MLLLGSAETNFPRNVHNRDIMRLDVMLWSPPPRRPYISQLSYRIVLLQFDLCTPAVPPEMLRPIVVVGTVS